MSEKYAGKSLVELREIAKERKIKSISALRKQELIDVLSGYDRAQAKNNSSEQAVGKDREKPVAAYERKQTRDREKSVTEYDRTNVRDKEKPASEYDRTNVRDKEKSAAEYDRTYTRDKERPAVDYDRQSVREKERYVARNHERQNTRYKDRTVGNYERQAEKSYMKSPDQNVKPMSMKELDSGIEKNGILEVMADGYGFIRCDNYLPGDEDVYVSPALIRKMNWSTGDIIRGNLRVRNQNEKFSALLYAKSVNGRNPEEALKRPKFESLTPVFPNERIHLAGSHGSSIAMRMMDLISPIGKGQRGMIVSQPKAGKTTLLKQVARAVTTNHPTMKLLVLLIDERPEEVTDIKESIEGKNVEVIYSTFDELPDNHKRVSEMVIERAKRLVEHGEDVIILLDSITRLARAYNLTVQPSGRTLSGGLDPAALHMPKRFFGAARNMREGGSLTILATALVETGSKMDDVVFEEFKGTGNMEIVLDRSLSEKRVFPAIDLPKSSTRRDDLLLNHEEMEANYLMRKAMTSARSEEAVERIINMFRQTANNDELISQVRKKKIL